MLFWQKWGRKRRAMYSEIFTANFGGPLGLDEFILRPAQQALVFTRIQELLEDYRKCDEELELLLTEFSPEKAGASREAFCKLREETTRITKKAVAAEQQIREATAAARSFGYSVPSEALHIMSWILSVPTLREMPIKEGPVS